LRGVGTAVRLDFKGRAGGNDVRLVEDVGEGQSVTSASRDRLNRRKEDGAIIIPLNGDEGQRAGESGKVAVGDQDGEVGVSSIIG